MSAVAPLQAQDSNQRATIAYVAPFLVFVGIMALEKMVPLPPQWLYVVRFVVVCAVIAAVSRPYLSFRPSAPLASIATVSYTHLRAHETPEHLVCRLLL